MKWFTKAADKQYAQAMNDIGELYNRALGVKKDQDKARE